MDTVSQANKIDSAEMYDYVFIFNFIQLLDDIFIKWLMKNIN